MSELNSKDHHWFRLANSNPPPGFYAFKDRFLKRFATHDGFDLQTVVKECWSCNGFGDYGSNEPCYKCNGSGIYATNEHWLARYKLGDSIYHKPVDKIDLWVSLDENKWPDPKNFIKGRIQHSTVEYVVANRSFHRLLLRHEPITLYKAVADQVKYLIFAKPKPKFLKLIRLRNKMDLFKAVPEDETIPF